VDYVEQPLWRIRLDGDVVLVTEGYVYVLTDGGRLLRLVPAIRTP
jgi:hypothetical protein